MQDSPGDRNTIRNLIMIQNFSLSDSITYKDEVDVNMIQRGIRTILRLKLPSFVRSINVHDLYGNDLLVNYPWTKELDEIDYQRYRVQ